MYPQHVLWTEALLMNIHNTCLSWRNKKILILFWFQKTPYLELRIRLHPNSHHLAVPVYQLTWYIYSFQILKRTPFNIAKSKRFYDDISHFVLHILAQDKI